MSRVLERREPAAPGGLGGLVDARTGIVRRLEEVTVPDHFPVGFAMVTSRLSATTVFSDWAADSAGAGYGFDGVDAAVPAAVGEAVERYCGNLVPDGLVHGSYDDLVRGGGSPVHPDRLCLFAPEQHVAPGFPHVPMTTDLALQWAEGTHLDDGSRVQVPAALVWGSHPLQPARPEAPPISGVVQAGLAAGPSWAFACTGGLREVLERDAMVMSWQGRGGLQPLRVPTWLQDLAAGPAGDLRVRFVRFADDLGVPVVGALVDDRRTGFLTLGTGCSPDPTRSALKALGEALQLQLLMVEYDDPASGIGRASLGPTSPLARWRVDRAYARSYRPDLSDVRDYGCHLQLYLDPAVRKAFERELAAELRDPADLSSLAPADGHDDDLSRLLYRLADHGLRAVAVDLTTPDVATAGLRVVRVLVPGCYGNSAAGLPLLGGPRMAARRRLLAAQGLRRLPLPH